MRHHVALCTLGLFLAREAWGGPSLFATETISFTSGASSPSAEAPTLTGTVPMGGVYNPRFRAGVSWLGRLDVGDRWETSLSWGLWRDQRFCDTCGDGEGPGSVGRELLGSTDASFTAARRVVVGEGRLRIAAVAVVPASRDALVCNPMVGAPGASVTLTHPIGGSAIRASARALRPVYVHAAAPVGRCAPRLRGTSSVPTLTGAVDPTPWDSTRTAGPNPSFTGSLSVSWFDPHALVPSAPGWLITQLSVGLDTQRNRRDPEVTVPTLSGPVRLDRSARPVTASVPWSVGIGLQPTARTDVVLSLSNQLPTWIADPGGALRALPARTTATVQVQQRFGGATPRDL